MAAASAYAALLSLTRLIEELLDNDQHPPYSISLENKNILESLLRNLFFLLDLFDLNSKETVESLAGRIRNSVYQAEDLIESFIVHHISSEDNLFLFENGNKCLKRIMKELESIVEKAKKIMKSSTLTKEPKKITKGSVLNNNIPIVGSSRLASNSKKMVFFDEDITKIKDWLCGESSSRLQMVSIVGMGGAGKTTLARHIFDDSLVAYRFDRRAWVTISQEYRKRDILLGLVNDVIDKTEDFREQGDEELKGLIVNEKNEDFSKMSDEELKEYVYKNLKGRRYLIVIDDVWDTNVWDDFRRVLPDDCNGSQVVITTRLLEVASYVDDSHSHLHQMQFLNEDQSWNLLREKIFARDVCPEELEIIGKKIAVRCGGLPLALVLAAGLLAKAPRTWHDWEKFAASAISLTLAADDGVKHNVTKIVSLSYDHLPHHLKPCLLYIGGFPEDFEIRASSLLLLWIAEGFVRPRVESKSLEEMAEDYLEDLAGRNLVLVTRRRSTGEIGYCRIHDVLRDFCIQKARDENFFVREDKIENNNRRLFLLNQNSDSPPRNKDIGWVHRTFNKMIGRVHGGFHLRSLIDLSASQIYMDSTASTTDAIQLLRVYHTLQEIHYNESYQTSSQVDFIAKLFLLRYASWEFLNSRIFLAISRLTNLQTLIIESMDSFSLSELENRHHDIHVPDEIWKMPRLRHLILHPTCKIPNPIVSAGYGVKASSLLQNLRTLSRVKDFYFDQELVRMIPNLKKLGVAYSMYYSRSEYAFNHLYGFHNLESLELNFGRSLQLCDINLKVAFPQKLRKISLRGPMFDSETICHLGGTLQNLQVLKLRDNYVWEEWETIEGHFPQLKFLLMERMRRMRHWRAESSHFPSLERLVIRWCQKLEEIPSEIGDIPTLQLIEIDTVSESVATSAMRIQEYQQDMGNDSLQVRTTETKAASKNLRCFAFATLITLISEAFLHSR